MLCYATYEGANMSFSFKNRKLFSLSPCRYPWKIEADNEMNCSVVREKEMLVTEIVFQQREQ